MQTLIFARRSSNNDDAAAVTPFSRFAAEPQDIPSQKKSKSSLNSASLPSEIAKAPNVLRQLAHGGAHQLSMLPSSIANSTEDDPCRAFFSGTRRGPTGGSGWTEALTQPWPLMRICCEVLVGQRKSATR